MVEPPVIDTMTIEIHRLGPQSEEGVVRKGERYIVLSGADQPAAESRMELTHEDFIRSLSRLRYGAGQSSEKVDQALDTLSRSAGVLLPELRAPGTGRALQIDLVLSAAELWAFPFESRVEDGTPSFANGSCNRILTRRIRQGFVSHVQAWPVTPTVLFVHAPAAADLSRDLIDAHTAALRDALAPWSSTGDAERDGLLEIKDILSPKELANALDVARGGEGRRPFTHVHVLAHGKPIEDPETGAVQWGLRLGDEARDASDPARLAEILAQHDGLPVTVTVAACDSANQARTAIPKRSFAQELHRTGTPIVLASQLPLTQAGSVVMTRAFYRHLLRGEDARWALHRARLDLASESAAEHDWVSLVGYVQLPEGYGDHLMEVGVKQEIALLRAARRRLDHVFAQERAAAIPEGKLDERLDQTEREIGERIASLETRLASIPTERRDLRDECQGILGSAHKRRAEVLFRRSERRDDEDGRRDRETSRRSLERALACYRDTYRANIDHHWTGVQQIALEAVLDGCVDRTTWDTTLHAASLTVAGRRRDYYWAYGTLAELYLVAPLLDGASRQHDAKRALELLAESRREDPYAIPATRDQLARYTNWWTKDNGFFGDRSHDLAEDAQRLIDYLAGLSAPNEED